MRPLSQKARQAITRQIERLAKLSMSALLNLAAEREFELELSGDEDDDRQMAIAQMVIAWAAAAFPGADFEEICQVVCS